MRKNILIVDDSKISQVALSDIIRNEYDKKVNIITVDSGEELLKSIKLQGGKYFDKIDLVILDYFMPFVNGEEVVNVLQFLKIDKPILFVTSITEDDEKLRILNTYQIVKGVFTKPFKTGSFGTKLKQILND